MSVSRARSALYRAARFLGDVQAVQRGRIPQRIVNRAIARAMFRSWSKLWR